MSDISIIECLFPPSGVYRVFIIWLFLHFWRTLREVWCIISVYNTFGELCEKYGVYDAMVHSASASVWVVPETVIDYQLCVKGGKKDLSRNEWHIHIWVFFAPFGGSISPRFSILFLKSIIWNYMLEFIGFHFSLDILFYIFWRTLYQKDKIEYFTIKIVRCIKHQNDYVYKLFPNLKYKGVWKDIYDILQS